MYRNISTVVLLCWSLLASAQRLQYPQTREINHIDSYFGTAVADPYRWLEADTAKDVGDWVSSQNAVTFRYLEKIPFRTKLKERLTALWNYPKYGVPFREGKRYYFFKNNGLQSQSVLFSQEGLSGSPSVFFDPNKLSTDGTVALNGFDFSKDGRYFAYAVSRSGSDWKEYFVLDASTGRLLPDHLRWSKFGGLSWRGNGFYYSAYAPPADTTTMLSARNEYHKVFFHALGSNQADDRLIFEDPSRALRTFGSAVSDDERFLFISASEGTSKGNALYVQDFARGDSRSRPITELLSDEVSPVHTVGDRIFLLTNRNATNRKLVIYDATKGQKDEWVDLISERDEVIQSVSAVGGKLIITYIKDVTHRVYVYAEDGTLEREVPLPELGTVSGFGGKKEDQVTFFSLTSFTFPSTIYSYDLASGTIALHQKPEVLFNPSSYETRQVFYTSKDGTRIPMFIVHRKGVILDGTNPTLLYGYGGFNISMMPSFSVSRVAWLELGGVYALANLRGGGEYGEKWHEAGTGLKKQNVFDDFIAGAEYLIDRRYTSPSRLAIMGGSNGGLLVGAAMTQRPDLFRVALPQVGVMDMLRFHKFTIGWAWVRDYGSSDDSTDFRNLYAYSPLHNIRSGVAYPATLVTTADHDDRVVPAHSFKFIATLQERYKGDNPVLIRIETKAGHGAGKPTSKQIEEVTDIYAFTLYNMNVTPSN
jgi:prolyl oligopeptidase